LEEQLHRWNVCERAIIWEALGVWESEGWDGELVFCTQTQHLSARDQELDIRAGFQQLYKRCGRRDDVFKVVQEQEPVLVALRGLEPFQQRLRSALGESNAVSDGRHHEGGIANGSEGDNVNTIREVMHQVPSDLERQTRFAHASRAGEGEQANVGAQEQSVESLHLLLTANELCE
jgi:hypothetical protein